MSEKNQSWFHCGRCGKLFLSEPGDTDGRLCPHCGFDPGTGAPSSDSPKVEAKPLQQQSSTTGDHRQKRTIKKPKPKHTMLKLVTGWIIVLAMIVAGAKYLWPEPATKGTEKVADAEKAARINREDDQRKLNQILPDCSRTFSSFLAAGNFEQRSQFVLNPVAATSRMVRFYSQNPLISVDATQLENAGQTLLQLPDGSQSVEARWTTKDGRTIDACFRQDEDEWLLDWEHFARYSDYPWALFLAGSGPAEGEFRLLARERLAEERKDSPSISLVLYAPRFGKPEEPGFQSPELLVSRNQRDGKLLDEAFRKMRDEEPLFDSPLPALNPDGMIRVRVKVKRLDTDQQRTFNITEVIACHWMSIDDPGVSIKGTDADESGSQGL